MNPQAPAEPGPPASSLGRRLGVRYTLAREGIAIGVRAAGPVRVLYVEGTADAPRASLLKEALFHEISQAPPRLVVQLDRAAFVSSAAWALLVVAAHRMQLAGGALVLACMPANVLQYYRALALSDRLPSFISETAAVAGRSPAS